MIRNSAAVEIARPAAEVFPWLVEPEKLRQWVEGLVEARSLPSGRLGPGSRFQEVVREHGRTIHMEVEVAAFEEGRRLEARLTAKEFEVTSRYDLEEAGGRTRITHRCETALRGLARLLAPIAGGTIQKKLEGDLRRLKEILERPPAAGA